MAKNFNSLSLSNSQEKLLEDSSIKLYIKSMVENKSWLKFLYLYKMKTFLQRLQALLTTQTAFEELLECSELSLLKYYFNNDTIM